MDKFSVSALVLTIETPNIKAKQSQCIITWFQHMISREKNVVPGGVSLQSLDWGTTAYFVFIISTLGEGGLWKVL